MEPWFSFQDNSQPIYVGYNVYALAAAAFLKIGINTPLYKEHRQSPILEIFLFLHLVKLRKQRLLSMFWGGRNMLSFSGPNASH